MWNLYATDDHGYVAFIIVIPRGIFSFMAYHRNFNKSSEIGTASGAGTDYPSGVPEFQAGFQWGSWGSSLVLCVVLCGLLVVLSLSFPLFCCPLYCQPFFDLRLLITPLGYSKLCNGKFQSLFKHYSTKKQYDRNWIL